jgi:hypothetical protein
MLGWGEVRVGVEGLKNGFMNIFVLNWLFRKNLFSKKCKFDIYCVL